MLFTFLPSIILSRLPSSFPFSFLPSFPTSFLLFLSLSCFVGSPEEQGSTGIKAGDGLRSGTRASISEALGLKVGLVVLESQLLQELSQEDSKFQACLKDPILGNV